MVSVNSSVPQSVVERRWLTVTKVVVVLGWTVAIGLVAVSTVQDNPLRVRAPWARRITYVTPERWGFFTKSVQEPDDYVYRVLPESARPVLIDDANAEPRYVFGLRKTPRLRMLEATWLAGQVPERRWSDCRSVLASCLASGQGIVTQLMNTSRTRYLCGRLIIVRRPPIPWAWKRIEHRTEMPSSFAIIEAVCTINDAANETLE